MKLFIDSADIDEIQAVLDEGILDGVTTNPSLIKKAAEKHTPKGKKFDMDSYIKKILKLCKGKPVSLEVIGTTYEDMVKEGEFLYKKYNPVAKNVYVKIPVNPALKEGCETCAEGVRAIATLSKKGIPVNATLIFTPEQALFAAKAGAKFVSPFMGRIDDYIRNNYKVKFEKVEYFPEEGMHDKKGDVMHDHGIVSGVDLIASCLELFELGGVKAEVLAASIRNQRQFREVGLLGCDIATVPYNVIRKFMDHPLTIAGMNKFVGDVVPEYERLFASTPRKARDKK